MNVSRGTRCDADAVAVLGIRPLANAGNVRAFVSIRRGDVTVHDCRVIQQPDQRPWMSMPQREYLQDGQKRYAAVVELRDALKREVSRVVLAQWERKG